MKQLLQDLGGGETLLVETPEPAAGRGSVVIASQRSLVSIGTERSLIEFGKANLLEKAKKQPDKVKQVLAKVKTDGFGPTLEAVRSKLAQPIPMGYSNAGVVIDVGPGVHEFRVGDRVASNGAHAEVVAVPENLVAKIPDDVHFDQAAFAVVGSIGLQGIRLAAPTYGETVFVMGLGLIGLLTVQMLVAQGVNVVASDFEPAKCALGERFGATVVNLSDGGDPVAAAMAATRGHGVDSVLITAATQSNAPMQQATAMARQKGMVVLVGVTGLDLQRDWFYKKELKFAVSCSYGPGRYADNYEGKGLDYPLPYVRWTAQRNMEQVLAAIEAGHVDVEPLIAERHPFDTSAEVYGTLKDQLGVLLEYPERSQEAERIRSIHIADKPTAPASKGVIAMVGAGNFATRTLLPALKQTPARFKTIASSGGVSAQQAAQKFGFEQATTDLETIWSDPEIDTVFLTTRHGAHASQVVRALNEGKKVFVEKPLALTSEQLDEVRQAYEAAENPWLMVGFNRRFAPATVEMRRLSAAMKDVKSIVYTVNAGAIPKEVWVQDPESGGGRIVGEACHMIDLCRFVVGAPIERFHAMGSRGSSDGVDDDKCTISMRFEDGSIATVHYLANGNASFPKERVELFCSGKNLILDNFRRLESLGWSGAREIKGKMDKGHAAECAEVVKAIQSGEEAPIRAEELFEISQVAIDAAAQARA